MWKNYDWLNAGGAEIVLEVVRRMGWTVEVESAEEWGFLPDIVAVGDRKKNTVWVNGEISPWLQALAVVAIADTHFHRFANNHTEYILPLFHARDCLDMFIFHEADNFIDKVRYSSEAIISNANQELNKRAARAAAIQPKT